jgi:uncharacterized protein YbgA (DUF1722 family)/uncharacterized protein YbbK (DUF523 family)
VSSPTESGRLRLGISACLLGENVRWNGGHKRDRYLTDTLGQYVEWVPVCPEVECGLPTPREPLRLVGDPAAPRLITSTTGIDKTDQMTRWAKERVARLEEEDLCGFIFKSGSPSSGMERVKVYNAKGVPEKKGVGMFARAFMEHFPLLPVEEDGRLHDMGLRENFIERIFALRRWRDTVKRGRRRGNLVDFHTRHKLLILSHSTEIYREMGRLVAHAKEHAPTELFGLYEQMLMDALRLTATRRKHTNVLQHILGYFKKQLSADEKQEMVELIGQYRLGHTTLVVPIALLNHYVRKYDEPYLAKQCYLHPHPVELQLRNHV